MQRIGMGRISIVSAGILVWICCAFLPAFSSEPAVGKLLPPQECAEGWVIEEQPVLYTKDNLFDYINGEAEIYFPYGFESLATARYVSTKNPAVSLVMDVYKMGSLTEAFGIYANYRRSDDDSVKAGADAVLSSSQMLMYQDRYYARLQASGAPEIERDVFLACGQALSIKLPRNMEQPKELDVFKIAALTPKSERYIAQSVLGYVFLPRGFMADATVNGEPAQIFMVTTDTENEARAVFNQYRAHLKESGKEAQVLDLSGGALLTAIDPLYSGVAVQQTGRYVIGVVRLKNRPAAKPLLEELVSRLRP